MIPAAVAFAFGCWLLQRQADLPGTSAITLCIAGGLALAWLAHRAALPTSRGAAQPAGRDAPPRFRPVVRCTLFAAVVAGMFVLGFGWAALRATLSLSDALGPQWEGRDVRV